MANAADVWRAKRGREHWNEWALSEVTAGRSPEVDFSALKIDIENFRGFQFPGRVSFAHSTFLGSADFHEAKFSSEVTFYHAAFSKNASFASAEFLGDASFTGASFAWDTWFTDVTFVGQAWFLDALFSEDVEFSEVSFSSNARFAGATFLGTAWFYDATFSRGALFTGAIFASDARFGRAKFSGGIDEFSDVRFGRVPDFRTSRFTVPPHFRGSTIAYTTSSANRLLQRLLRCASDDAHAASYRRLKQFAAEAKDHNRELDFFALELRAKRFHETTGFWPISINVAYDWLSDYGRSISRPIIWLAALVIVAMAGISYAYWTTACDMLANLGAVAIVALIPAGLSFDRCPFAGSDRRDADGVGTEPVPGVAASLDDVLVTLPDAPAELVAAEIFPDVLDRIEFGRVGWQAKQGDVFWHGQSLSGLVPAGPVADQHGM